jgi:site-specific recombinase XerD
LRNYSSACRRLLEYLSDDTPSCPALSSDAPLAALSADQLIGIPQWLFDKGLSANSRATYLSALHNVVSYFFREELLLLDAQQYERLKAAFKDGRKGARRKLPYVPGHSAIDQLLDFIRRQTIDEEDTESRRYRRRKLRQLRDIAMFALLRDLGLRPQELVDLRRENLDRDRQELIVEKTKSKQGRRLAVGDETWAYIWAYLDARRDKGTNKQLRELPLLSAHSRRFGDQVKPVTTRAVRLLAQQYVQKADVEVILTPYSLRHQAGTDFWEETGDIVLVRDFLGHEDVSTSQIYVKVGNTDVNKALRGRAARRAAKDEDN